MIYILPLFDDDNHYSRLDLFDIIKIFMITKWKLEVGSWKGKLLEVEIGSGSYWKLKLEVEVAGS